MNILDKIKSNKFFNFSENEDDVLKLWKDINLLEKLKESRKDGPTWNFLDGPPFVNGNPHHGHLLVSTIKDVLARYYNSLGYQVSYQIGFDCHGLPMEQAAENELGKKINSDASIEEIAIFNKKCQEIQDRCSDKFERVLSRIGRQFESDKTYYTSDLSYMNALWYAFKILFDKGLIYQGKKVMPYSYGCQTALSNFEANQNYQTVTHTSLYLKFKISDKDDEYFLVWTTTPWSLVANQALCLNPDLEYVLVKDNKSESKYWVAKELYPNIFKKEEKIIDKKLGKELRNLKYIPVFNFFGQESFITLNDNYVTSESGTGIVHMAPLFGADDFRVCQDNNIIDNMASNLPNFLNGEAKIKEKISIRDKDIKDMLLLDISDIVICYLKEENLYFKKESIKHNYPFCWRTDTPLIYLAQNSWFLNVQKIKDDLIKNNSEIKWFPEFVGTQRFNNWLEGAPDWCLSRDRFWGTPIPIWESDDDIICIGSKQELFDLVGYEVNNLHREHIDDIIIDKNGKKYKRINSVFDCWYESGMAGIAKEGNNCHKYSYPVDFIAESLDQTRGWFYTLNVLSTALYDKPAFKQVIVSGLILASDGMKMSKRLNNYTPPEEIIKEYGADVLRLYLLSSPATQAQEFRFTDSDLYVITKKLLPFFHAHKMLNECIENQKIKTGKELVNEIDNFSSEDLLDLWLLNLTNKLDIDISKAVKSLELYKVPGLIFKYIDSLTNIWVKFSRDRLKSIDDNESLNSISTLYNILLKVNIILSPFMPFNSEFLYNYVIYQKDNKILDNKSIHLLKKENEQICNYQIIESVDNMYNIIEIVRNARQEIRNNTDRYLNSPIKSMKIYLPEVYKSKINIYFDKYIKEQCNVETIDYLYNNIEYKMKPKNGPIGKKFKKESSKVIELIKNSKVDDIIENKVTYNFEGIDELVNLEYCLLIPNSEIKLEENYYLYQDGIYFIVFDITINEDLIWKTKLSLWKREIQELRKKLNYHIWNELKIDIENNSVKNLLDWKDYFQELTGCKINIVNRLDNNSYNFKFEDENYKYFLSDIK